MARYFVTSLAFACALTFSSLALGADAAKTDTSAKADTSKDAAKGDSDKLDLKQLEDKYWSAKDTDFSVIQNRAFSKDHRWFVSASYGTLINDPYSTGQTPAIDVGYYFSEHWGLQLSRENGILSDNKATAAFASSFGAKPNYNRFQDYNSLNILWVPLYAKMSALDKAIWYFDLQFGLGVGMVDYQQQVNTTEGGNINQSAFGVNLDTTAHIFFSKNWAFRMDIKNTFAPEDLLRYTMAGSGAPSRDMGVSTEWDTSFLLGLTYFFGSRDNH